MRLTPKQQAFADYYIETGNATEAAVKAGYSQKTARFIGAENLTKPNIKSYIDQRLKEIEGQRIADAQEVLEYLTRVMRGEEIEEVVGFSEYGAEIVKKLPYVKDRVKAAELLGKRYTMWTEKQQVENLTPVFVEDVPEDDD